MNTEIVKSNNGNGASAPTLPAAVEAALIDGDLSNLSVTDRISYYNRTCESVGLNPYTQPFAYILLNGKLRLYAKKDCTEQLRGIQNVSICIIERRKEGDLYIVTAKAKLPSGREDENIGAISIKGLSGDVLANALMKAETKAKRRVTLSICGLGWLDESETGSIHNGQIVSPDWQPHPGMATIEALAEMPEPERPPLVTTEESLENPWKHTMQMGKYKGARVYTLPPSVLSQAERAFRQNRITESDWVNCRDAVLNEHLKETAMEEDSYDQSDIDSLTSAIKGKDNE